MPADRTVRRIGVSAICPSYTDTGFVANLGQLGVNETEADQRRANASKVDWFAASSPDKVARAIVRAVTRN
jgi:NAD(P)-dependent dehydrogenase (short-subunit alcohol dehydrogenase family)